MTMNLLNFRYNEFSQNGEDGVIKQVFSLLNITEGYVCEFGAADGIHLSNTYNIYRDNRAFTPILIESKDDLLPAISSNLSEVSQKHIIHAEVDADASNPSSLDNLLLGLKIPDLSEKFRLLSIDVDGPDYGIWEGFVKFRPDLVIIEVESNRWGFHNN